MKKLRLHKGILAILLLFTGTLFAQEAITITGTQYVKKGETMSVGPDQTILFDPGASLVVEGGLKINGSLSQKVKIASKDPNNPGNGIIISKVDIGSTVDIKNASFQNLTQPLRFDPFWYRKEVSINNTEIIGSKSGEAVLYVSKPLLDLEEDKTITVSLSGLEVTGNSGGVILDAVGAAGINYNLNGLLFTENKLSGDNNSFGVLHLEGTTQNYNAAGIKANNLAFNRNYAGSTPVGLSVGGGTYDMNLGTLYKNESEDIVYDRQKNVRIPKVNFGLINSIASRPGNEDIILGVNHIPGQVQLNVKGGPTVEQLKDASGQPVIFNTQTSRDSLKLNYLSGNPSTVVLANGVEINIPELEGDEVVDSTLTDIEELEEAERSDDTTGFAIKIIKYNKEDVIGEYEIGLWGGAGIYGDGDIGWKAFWLPPTLEWSFGAYGQYNFLPNWSLRASYYYTRISAYNPYAPGQLSGNAQLYTLGTGGTGRIAEPFNNSFPINFRTTMHILEATALYHIRSWEFGLFGNKVLPSVSLGLGAFHYTPYRIQWVDEDNFNKIKLRELGTEGQNFLPGKEQYSTLAAHINLGVQISYSLGERWSLNGEGKLIMTSTDYLDDFGQGIWYGGDFAAYEAAARDAGYSTQDIFLANPWSPEIAKNAPRATNSLNDFYYQLHIGLSYKLGK